MYAVIETGGKQYKVAEGDTVFVEKLGLDEGAEVTFEKVAALGKDDGLVVGAPYVDGAKVSAKVIKNGKEKKILVFKFKAKKNYRRRKGHRQPYTKVQIEKIEG
ncbi:50S ribosomal protein L21 [Ethanoligenens harbinense]|uniref:Large ribosomal subunit protein bL21 n=1 Tax=Ethanoligenens harbinense (strain DSM 18485 / JCM 12961 / CGMCC 1.5033 / YUAN-3) TaxID=663278 RepID=E6U8U8_ETHHY|nr:50S ribosomal protein L21 [Ethanoligenens harbinense]ADU27183.1 ribosomal protein L21 [Ethanoligenens harbinense YUAN-3]AVQ96251.1 50S ribosomal protein L21 [Ethanoligenens harbinense YUAN-3]AYF38911.1 50S ribosomal protein L21 [Ethanoligenens harbinense]AYF41661.1 50S ribosomal protein L21 [Ethanoligenens harbinense]QCN92492.1 50S ribosomal protein L21 [Ethanoligenens harbinense]